MSIVVADVGKLLTARTTVPLTPRSQRTTNTNFPHSIEFRAVLAASFNEISQALRT